MYGENGQLEDPINELKHGVITAGSIQEELIQREFRDVVRILLTAARKGCCLVGSLALNSRLQRLGIKSKLKIGFKLCYYHTYSGVGVFATRHVWLEACGRVWDVGNAMNVILFPHLRQFPYNVTYKLPAGVPRSDSVETEEQRQVTLLEYLFTKLTSVQGYTEQYKKDMIKHGWPRVLVNKLFVTTAET